MNVSGYEEIDATVAVIICPGRAGAEAPGAHSRFLGYVFEFAISLVVIKSVAAKSCDVNILQSVIIVIGDGDAHSPALTRKACGDCDVGELELRPLRVGFLMIESDHRVSACAISRDRGTAHHEDVEFAVIIAVDETDASAHGFDNVFLVGRRNVRNSQAGCGGDVFKLGW